MGAPKPSDALLRLLVDSHGTRSSAVALKPLTTPHIAISMPPEDTERDLEQMEEDEEAMRRANAEVVQMQKRMMDGELRCARWR